MAINLNDNIAVLGAKPTDARYLDNLTPYASVGAAEGALAANKRYTGLTVNVGGVEYWFATGIDNGELVVKDSGLANTGITTASNGLTKTGTDVALGGTLTGNTTINVATHDMKFSGDSIQYTADYKATYVARSLTDKGFVDGCATAAYGCSDACSVTDQSYADGCDSAYATIAYGCTDDCSTADRSYADGCDTQTLSSANSYTDTCTLACTITASNGLTKVDQNITLGGALTGDTYITGSYTVGVNVTTLNLTGATTHIGGCVSLETTPSGTGELVCRDASTGELKLTSLSGLGGISGGTNGICDHGDEQLGLGGSLTENTCIDGAFTFTVDTAQNICLATTTTKDIAFNAMTNGGIYLKSQSGTVASSSDTADAVGIQMDFNGAFQVFDNRAGAAAKGICYSADYSTNYDDRSLVDKAYVDSVATGLAAHAAACIATTGSDITLSGNQTIDGILTTDGDRVLVKDQTNGALNGIYSANTSAWGRTDDYNFEPSGEIGNGDLIPVLTGDTNISTLWILTTPDPIVSGDTLTFAQFSRLIDVTGGDGIAVTTLGTNRDVAVDLISSNCGLCINGSKLGLNFDVAGSGLTASSGIITVNASTCGAIGGEIPVLFNASCQLVVDSDDFSYTTANNGLHKEGCNVVLGGPLTGATVITVASDTCSLKFTDTAGTKLGIQYSADYSSGFGDNSLITKCFVDGCLSTGLITASNGLTKVDQNITLGGTLTGATTINGAQTLSVNITTFNVTGATNITGAIDGSSTLDILGAASLHSTLDVTGNTDITGTLDVGNTVTLDTVAEGSTSDDVLSITAGGVIQKISSGGITGAITGATNGLTKSGQVVILGGALTGNTNLTGAYDLGFTHTNFNVTAAVCVTGVVDMSSTLGVGGASTLAAVTASGAADLNSTLNVSGAASLQSTLDVTGATSLCNTLTLPTVAAGATTNPIMVLDSGVVKCVSASSYDVTAVNGLSASGNEVKLGGSLTGNTTIDGAFTLSLTGATNLSTDTGYQISGTDILIIKGAVGCGNLGVGYNALLVNAAGKCNTSVGTYNLQANTTGCRNTAIGYNVLGQKVDGCNNIGIGTGVLAGIGDSDSNIGIGCTALGANTTGSYNTAIGTGAISANISGIGNTALGHFALQPNQIGSNNVAIGRCAGAGSGNAVSNKLYIANCADCSLISGDFTGKTVTLDAKLTLSQVPTEGDANDSVLVRHSSGEVRTVAGSELGEDNNRYSIDVITVNGTLPTTGYTILVSGATSVTLPSPVDGMAFKIKDAIGSALASPITIVGTIDGDSNALINTDYGALELVYSSTIAEWLSLAFIN